MRGRYEFFSVAVVSALGALVGCGGGSGAKRDGAVAPGGLDGSVVPGACADLFDEGTLNTYSVDISATEWAAITAEFQNVAALESGASFAVYHPVVLHLNGETVSDAEIKLHGQSSWYQ